MVNTAPSTGSHTDPEAAVEEAGSPTPRWAWGVAGLVAAIPVVRMLLLVLQAHRLPYNDYWPMIDSVLTDQGGFDVGGLFELRNEHPIVVAKLLYWLNLQATGGSNIALGLVVVGIALGQVAVVVALGRDLARRWPLAPPLLMVVAAYLLFGRQGAWHFVKSMSGAAWLTANLFALLAIWAQVRGRAVLAVVFAVVATFSYGTGLLVWPVLILVGLMSGTRLRQLLPTLAIGIALTVWLQVLLADLGKTANDRPPLQVWGARGAEVIGAFFFPGHGVTSIRFGEVLIALAVVGSVVAIYGLARRSDDARLAAPWVGCAAYGVGMGLLVAAGRNTFLWTGTASRYAAIGAITCLGVIGLAFALVPRRPSGARLLEVGAIAAVGLLCVGVFVGGAKAVDMLDDSRAYQDLLAVGLETELLDGSRLWLGGIEELKAPGIEDKLEKAGHDFGLEESQDCGLLGDTIVSEPVSPSLPVGVRAEVTRLEPGNRAVPLGMVFDGWVEGAAIDCAVLIDLEGNVIGAGGHGSVHDGFGGPGATEIEGREWFSGLAPLTDGTSVHVRLEGHDELFALPPPGG